MTFGASRTVRIERFERIDIVQRETSAPLAASSKRCGRGGTTVLPAKVALSKSSTLTAAIQRIAVAPVLRTRSRRGKKCDDAGEGEAPSLAFPGSNQARKGRLVDA